MTTFLERLSNGVMAVGSKVWFTWISYEDEKRCTQCMLNHGKVRDAVGMFFLRLRKHLRCRCRIQRLMAIFAGTATKLGEQGADWQIINNRKLPDNYITKAEARRLGWKSKKGNLAEVAPGKSIGGIIYHNAEDKLPDSSNRIWYEADLNYVGGWRGGERLYYSNDGLVFVSYNHADTFFEVLK